MDVELYETLAVAKARELMFKSWGLYHLNELKANPSNKLIGGVIREGIVRDFIRDYLPTEFRVKSGLVLDGLSRTMSPQADAIIYVGTPLLDYTDAAIVEKDQVRGIIEIKSYVAQNQLFGTRNEGVRNAGTGLISSYRSMKPFLPTGAKYVLFTFELLSSADNDQLLARLSQICDDFAAVLRPQRRRKGAEELERGNPNFDNSIGRMIHWLRTLK
jgi:hypothetical protein